MGIMDMIMVSGINTVHDEATLSKMIRNYGCHCFPDYTRKTTGQGPPQNDVDSACRDLNKCKKCLDLENLSADCENGDVDQGKYRKNQEKVNNLKRNILTFLF